MLVYNHSAGQDTGGQSYRIKRAFDRHVPGVAMRSVVVSPSYLDYPHDLMLHEIGAAKARRLYAEADVIHLHNTMSGLRRIGIRGNKSTVLHHHGTRFRNDHARVYAEARDMGAMQIACTIDLEVAEPGVVWVPSPFDLAEMARIKAREYRKSKTVRIAHAPTARAIKSTVLLVSAVEELKARGRKVKLDLIENVSWKECLVRKAKADLLFDQVLLGYGNNAIEAWAMGMPVIAGADDRVVPGTRNAMLSRFGSLPFYEATEQNLTQRLDDLVSDAELRLEYAARGLSHVEMFHDERLVAASLNSIYQSLCPSPRRERRTSLWTTFVPSGGGHGLPYAATL